MSRWIFSVSHSAGRSRRCWICRASAKNWRLVASLPPNGKSEERAEWADMLDSEHEHSPQNRNASSDDPQTSPFSDAAFKGKGSSRGPWKGKDGKEGGKDGGKSKGKGKNKEAKDGGVRRTMTTEELKAQQEEAEKQRTEQRERIKKEEAAKMQRQLDAQRKFCEEQAALERQLDAQRKFCEEQA